MIDLQMMALQLSQRSQHRPEDWHSILNAAIHDPAFTHMTDGEIDLLMAAMQSPEQLNWVLELFRDSYMKMTNEMPFDFMIRHVNQSSFGLPEWITALQAAHKHHQQDKKPTELSALVQAVKGKLGCPDQGPNGS
ncbi:MAG: hypothetical protein AB7N80_00835 [Bdellovibrionales bacterium]